MDVGELQAELRHFAAERDWQPFHTPKNLAMALLVEAAELAEIFQWMTPQASAAAHEDAEAKSRIDAEVADVLLYLLQVADHCRVDLPRAVRHKLVRNAEKYPAKRVIARELPVPAPAPPPAKETLVLLDYENVQPSAEELRALLPDARRLWVFHGPRQRAVSQRFAAFAGEVTTVPIGKTGKNALDFHLSFYLGSLAAQQRASALVVVANDKGYDPMLKHARALGIAVRRLAHGKAKATSNKVLVKKAAAKKTPTKEPVAKPAAARAAAAKTPAAKHAAAKKALPSSARKAPARKSTPT